MPQIETLRHRNVMILCVCCYGLFLVIRCKISKIQITIAVYCATACRREKILCQYY